MNKLPLTVISTDWHLKESNIEEVVDLVRQQCELAQKLNINHILCLGDVFNSRKSQPQIILNTLDRILTMVENYGLELWMIPGNHDKTVYSKVESFLDSFRYHPSLNLISTTDTLSFDKYDLHLHFLPFFSDDVWQSKFSALVGDHLGIAHDQQLTGKHILCSHIAVSGSVNNNGEKVESSIKQSQFKIFDKVFLGHYHNMHQVGKNIYHLPSIQQNDFGENNQKGFTILYSDGSHELHKSKFKEFIKKEVDINKISKAALNRLIDDYANKTEDNYIRLVLKGSEEKIKSINKDVIKATGIDVKTSNQEIEVDEIDFDQVEIKKYTKDSLLSEFSLFCQEFDKEEEKGLKYLKQL